ncbi:MAG TPA: peptidoglycan-associated lipoprotein Pal [Acidocella sp.]|nr:peptidoglycan-associated lipoprotein Pal [Acidocella sp.]
MKFKVLGAFAGLALLAACSSTPTTTASTSAGTGASTQGAAPGSEQDLVANVGDRVFFAFNKSDLTSDADATLARQAAWLSKYPSVNILIAGNADERGTETYNLALGNRRANAARDYLVAQGVATSRIQTISYGKDCPVAAGNDEASYQQNRNAITSAQGFNPQNCH